VIRYLIDADSSIDAMRIAASPVNRRIGECEVGEIGISAISFSEISAGTQLQMPPPPEVIAAFLKAIPVLEFGEAAAREYARLPFKRGKLHRLLAAHALSIGATVVTNNEADFADVPGLMVENWTV